ncbi:hypothetical protein BKI52_44945 [marine bacterium AO1-C]|nr:hypothetical protein BKI52_44945 [marine bacterium AO1-C]
MNTNFNLSIDRPCTEKFDTFHPTNAGGFCDSCQKEVIDFTQMSEYEIIQYFKNAPQKTCGRFDKSQLKTYSESIPFQRKPTIRLIGAGLMSLSLLFSPNNKAQAQNYTRASAIHSPQKEESKKQSDDSKSHHRDIFLKGTVLDKNDLPLLGVNIILKGTKVGVSTDISGKFKFPKAVKPGDVLMFYYFGFEVKKLEISVVTPDTVKVVLKEDTTCLLGEVNVTQVYKSKRTFWQKIKGLFR